MWFWARAFSTSFSLHLQVSWLLRPVSWEAWWAPSRSPCWHKPGWAASSSLGSPRRLLIPSLEEGGLWLEALAGGRYLAVVCRLQKRTSACPWWHCRWSRMIGLRGGLCLHDYVPGQRRL